MENRRALEFLILAMIIGLGGPIFAVLGARNGERMALLLYPKAEASKAAVAVDYEAIVLGGAGDAEKGQGLFQTNCVACHGSMADGKGPAAAALAPPPRDFLDAKARWTRSREPQDIYHTLSEGSPGTAMPGFANMLSVQDRWAIVHYLGTLPGVKGQFKAIDEAVAGAWRPEGAAR
jgi:mono/diheme cytochrome c family protein